jgi:type II secretory pathway pseudopilin PulG
MHRIKTARRAATLVELGIGLGLLTVLFVLAWTLVSRMGDRFVRVSRTSAAMTAAELALAHLLDDAAAMLPPDPRRPETLPRLDEDGRRLSFFRVEARGDRLVAQPVIYLARRTSKGNFELLRNGRQLPQVLLSRFDVQLVSPERDPTIPQLVRPVASTGAGGTGTSDLEVSNPVLRFRLTGIARDVAPRELAPAERHVLPASLPLPATTPAAMAALPPAAKRLLERAVSVSGSLL